MYVPLKWRKKKRAHGHGAHVPGILFDQVRNMKTLGEALEVFTKEEVVSFKWDKEVNADTGALNNQTPKTWSVSGCFIRSTSPYDTMFVRLAA